MESHPVQQRGEVDIGWPKTTDVVALSQATGLLVLDVRHGVRCSDSELQQPLRGRLRPPRLRRSKSCIDETPRRGGHAKRLYRDLDRPAVWLGDDQGLDQVSAGAQGDALGVQAPVKVLDSASVGPLGIPDTHPDWGQGAASMELIRPAYTGEWAPTGARVDHPARALMASRVVAGWSAASGESRPAACTSFPTGATFV